MCAPRVLAALVLNMGYVLGQSGWAVGTAVALVIILLLRDCGQRLIGCCEELQAPQAPLTSRPAPPCARNGSRCARCGFGAGL